MLKSNRPLPIISSCFTFSCTVAITNEPAYRHSPHSTGQGQYSSKQNGRGHVSKSLLSVNSNDRDEMGWCRRVARHLPGFLQMASTRNPSDAPRAHVAVGSGCIRPCLFQLFTVSDHQKLLRTAKRVSFSASFYKIRLDKNYSKST
jgi:hypothetical protein